MENIFGTQHSLERHGCLVHYWVTGPADRPLVVFTHGATVDHAEWEITVPLVARHFRVLTWDMPGHGESRPAAFVIAEARADLLAILDTLGVKQATFVGHSMGGNLHQELVFHHPERVTALVCLDCTWNFQQLSRLEQFSLALAGPIFKIYPHRWLVDQSLAITAVRKETQAQLRPAVERLTKAEFIQIMLAGVQCLHPEPNYHIGKPLLLMVGDQDRTGNIRQAMPRWAAHEPGCEFCVIPRAKHAAHLDQPDFVHGKLLDFLERCATR